MKKFITIAVVAMAVVLGALSFTSCDDNDDDNVYYVRYSVGVIEKLCFSRAFSVMRHHNRL